MGRNYSAAIMISMLMPVLGIAAEKTGMTNPIFPFDSGVGRGKWTPVEQAECVKELGFDGIGYNYNQKQPELVDQWLAELHKRDLKLFDIYAGVTFPKKEGQRTWDYLREPIQKLKGTETMLWFTMWGYTNTDLHDEIAVPIITEVSDWCRESGIKLCLYAHGNSYINTADDGLRLAKKVNRPGLVGMSINLCHERAGGNSARLANLSKEAGEYLMLVSINGSDKDKMGILPIGKGDFDMFPFLKALHDVGYKGPVGIQCIGRGGDIRENLAADMNAWKAFSARIEPENKQAFQSPAWWVVGAFPRYTESDFKANETIENARNENPKGNEWNGLVGLGGLEFRGRQVPSHDGVLDLTAVCAPPLSNACAYAGFRVTSEKATPSILKVTAPGPVRCFLNNALAGEGVDTVKMNASLKAGMNSVLVKSWNTKGCKPWAVSCNIESDVKVSFEPVEQVAETVKPATGKRNVALWSEGARAATSSYRWRGTDKDQFGRNYINDGQSQGPAWSSLAQQNMPQWVWVKFAGPRKIDRLVLYAGQNTRDFAAEYSPDGGATFKKLFEKKDEKPGAQSSYAVDFTPVVADNVRVRITRVEKSATSGFDTASVSELEVYGEAADSSEKDSARGRADVKASKLKPERGFVPDIKEDASQLVVSTPWYRMNLDKARPRMSYLSLDATGRGEFFCNILRNAGAFPVVEPLFADTRMAEDGVFQRNGNVIQYPAVEVAQGVFVRVAFRFHERDYDIELTTLSNRRQPLRGGLFRFDLDFRQTPTSFYGRAEDPISIVTMPCYMNAPDCGTFRITQSGDGAVMRQYPSSDEFNLAAHCMFDVAPETTGLKERIGAIPEGTWQGRFNFAADPQVPFKDLVKDEPRLKGLPKYSLNIEQWRVDQGVLANNTVSTDCPLSLQFYAEMALYAPVMKDGISPMALVVPTVDRYLDGLGGHLMWHGFKVEVTPPGKWYASLETGGFMINSAWYAVRTLGEKNLLGRWLPRLEALAGHLEAHDIDGDGIVESGDRGHWFDTYAFPEGVKESHSTAVNYDAFRHLADLETLAGRKEQAAHWQARADLIKKNYLKVFFNQETGVIGGWRDKDGRLHDPMFPWVNGYAICAGLVDDALAKSILEKFLAKMKEIGFGEAQYKYGMLTNLLPLKLDEWNHHGAHEWQGYMNGSITSPYSNYFIMSLYKHGFHEIAEKMLWAQVESFDKGTFNSGVRIPHLPVRNPVGSAFYKWDGSSANGEGYLPENWHAYAGIFAGHYGIRFDENGYSLESWSPLKGKEIHCGLPVMGKIQQVVR